ncbi:MAG: hypothetical protein J6328_03715 [Bacilli bacterium]|nr:hypothetical protein [Bacilli bacterium]
MLITIMTMSLLILIIATIACFGLLFFFRHFYDSMALISVAIGAAINANIYNSGNMPIEAGWIIFGIDSMLYSLFMFTIIYRAKDYSIPSAKSMTTSAVIAILISALIEMFARWSYNGHLDWDNGKIIIGYVISAFATVVAVWVMLLIFKRMENKKRHTLIEFVVCLFAASMIHSLIYSGLLALISWEIPVHVLRRWVGSIITRLVSTGLGGLIYYLNNSYWKPRDLEIRFRGDSQSN